MREFPCFFAKLGDESAARGANEARVDDVEVAKDLG